MEFSDEDKEKMKEVVRSEADVFLKWIGDLQRTHTQVMTVLKAEDADENLLISAGLLCRLHLHGLTSINNACLDMSSIDEGKPLEDLLVFHTMQTAKQIKKQDGREKSRLILPN